MKADAKRKNMLIRVSDAQIAHVKMLAKEHACSMSAVLRHLKRFTTNTLIPGTKPKTGGLANAT